MSNPTTARVYIVGLDAWRAALMLGGIVLHGSMGLPSNALFRGIDVVSQTFRMGAFFGIAGVLAALVMANRSPAVWLQRRLVQLGLPLTFGMLVISPLIWFMAIRAGGADAPQSPLSWYHLWFLAGLIIYSVVIYALIRTRLTLVIESRIQALLACGALRPSTVLLATAAASAALFGAAPSVMASTMSPKEFEAFRTLQLIAGYLPMFLLGYIMGRLSEFRAVMLTQFRGAATVVISVAAAYLVWFAWIAPQLDPTSAAAGTAQVRFVAAAICPPAAFVLILRSALSIRRVPLIVERISKASYTIYLLHLPIALSINLVMGPVAPNPYLSYLIAVIGSAILSFMLHEHLVRQSAFLSFLLNGKVGGRSSAAGSIGQQR